MKNEITKLPIECHTAPNGSQTFTIRPEIDGKPVIGLQASTIEQIGCYLINLQNDIYKNRIHWREE